MTKPLALGARIGIIGAGQLGKMMVQAAQKMGYRVYVYDPNPTSCAFEVANGYTIGSFDDKDALLDFVATVDVVTYEFENINALLLRELANKCHLPQGTELLLTTQDRLQEKSWLQSLGVGTVDFQAIDTFDQLAPALEVLGYPAILKTTRFGYDGKGQQVLRDFTDLETHRDTLEAMLEASCVLEAFCDFTEEVSVMVARDLYGTIEVFPISHNVHLGGILYQSRVGQVGTTQVMERIHHVARTIAHEGHLVGVCGIEFFLTEEGDVLVNELAPRPHNSGHYSMEACNVSQYDQHILAITGRHLQPVRLLSPVVMLNILGQHMTDLTDRMERTPDAMYHLYGKGEARHGRKMGHFTFVRSNEEAIDELLAEEWVSDWAELFER